MCCQLVEDQLKKRTDRWIKEIPSDVIQQADQMVAQ